MFLKKANTEKRLDFRTPEGFGLLYEAHARKLFTICFSRIKNREEAEEIVHDIFYSVWERREDITDKNGSIERYLMRSAKLKTIDFFRRQTNSSSNMVCKLEEHFHIENCTENILSFVELKEQVNQLVDQLPITCRKVYKLSREKGLSNKEVASALLISEKTVESHMTKALAHLRKNLAEYTTFILLISLLF
ncbi:MAG: RNA polymerase sigma-70 factor [Bacteroidota bacterium]